MGNRSRCTLSAALPATTLAAGGMRSRRHDDSLDRGAAHLAASDGGHHRPDPASETTASPSWPPAPSSPSGADQSSLGFPRVLVGEQRHRAVAVRPGLLPRERHRSLLPPGPDLHARLPQPRRHPSHDRPNDLRRGLDSHGAPPGERHRAGEAGEHGRLRRHGLARGLRVRPLRAARARRRDERSPLRSPTGRRSARRSARGVAVRSVLRRSQAPSRCRTRAQPHPARGRAHRPVPVPDDDTHHHLVRHLRPSPRQCRRASHHRPWYLSKTNPSFADMLAKLRRTIIADQYSPGRLRAPTNRKSPRSNKPGPP